MLNLSKTGGDHSGPASDHSAGGHTNVDDEDDLDEDDDNISDGEEDDIKDHGKSYCKPSCVLPYTIKMTVGIDGTTGKQTKGRITREPLETDGTNTYMEFWSSGSLTRRCL